MQAKVVRKINASQVEIQVEDKDLEKLLEQVVFLSVPNECGVCHKATENDIIWNVRRARLNKENQKGTIWVIERHCQKCGAVSQSSKFTDGGYYWKSWVPSEKSFFKSQKINYQNYNGKN